MQRENFAFGVRVAVSVVALLLACAVGHAATYTVSNNSDSGAGSFRQAIISVNLQLTGSHTITFSDTYAIKVASALPAINRTVTINGNGSTISAGSIAGTVDGLVLSGKDSAVIGLKVAGFSGNGIRVTASGVTIKGCRVGNYAKTTPGNGRDGILLEATADNAVIGAPDTTIPAVDGTNVIAGNSGLGISVKGASGVLIQNCIIGLKEDGVTVSGNGSHGVGGVLAADLDVGSTARGSNNTISGNGMDGVYLEGCSGTVVANRIGLKTDGTAAANGDNGVHILEPAGATTIGGATSTARNVISGNSGAGILGEGGGAVFMDVLGNYIGLNTAGTAAVPNTGDGVELDNSGSYNIGSAVEGGMNVISGNGGSGVHILNGNVATFFTNNRIGTNAAGTAAVPNQLDGVRVENASSVSFGGGAGFETLVSGNVGQGIFTASGATITGSLVIANCRVGVNAAGTGAIPNGGDGIHLAGTSGSSTIGGPTGAPNVVASGNTGSGLFIDDPKCQTVSGVYAGVGVDGVTAIPNGLSGLQAVTVVHLQLGRVGNDARNIFSGNTFHGAVLMLCSNAEIMNGRFGVDALDNVCGNGQDGLRILTSASVAVGGNAAKANVFAGNHGSGMWLEADNSGLAVEASYNGFGMPGKGNAGAGVHVQKTVVKAANPILVSLSQNLITGNGVGVSVDASAAVMASVGLHVNTIYGNTGKGIELGAGVHLDVAAPQITQFFPYIIGTATPNAQVTLYVDDEDEGEDKVATTTAAADGSFFAPFDLTAYRGRSLTALATLPGSPGRTSEFSRPLLIHEQTMDTVLPNTASRIDLAIPDNDPAGLSHTITVDDPGLIQDLDLALTLDHPLVGQLAVTLTHNDTGTTAALIQLPGNPATLPGCTQANYQIVLDDEGDGGPIEDQCLDDLASPPNYTPNNPLSVFDGEELRGTWTLKIEDMKAGGSGALRSWGLKVNNTVGAPVVFVDKTNGVPGAGGRSWLDAFPTIQEGLDAAALIDAEVWVAQGVYNEVRNHMELGVNTGSLVLHEGSRLYGALPVGALSRNERDPIFYQTTIDGSIARDGQPAFQTVRAETFKSVLMDTFTISGGRATGATGGGGLLALEVQDLTLRFCSFEDNQGVSGGAAIYLRDSAALMEDCTVENNSDSSGAGVLSVVNTPLTANRCSFRDNEGGGVNCRLPESTGTPGATFTDCFFVANTSPGAGLRFIASGSGSLFKANRCHFLDNETNAEGGALYAHFNVMGEVVNSVFNGNTAEQFGNAVASRGIVVLNSCSLNANNGAGQYAVYAASGGKVYLFNSILWAGDESFLPLFNGTQLHGLVQGVSTTPLFGADPMFVNAATGDLRLQEGSPCIDYNYYLGSTTELGPLDAPAEDILRTPRPQQGANDVGAYEMVYGGVCGGATVYSQATDPATITLGFGQPVDDGTVTVLREFNLAAEFGTTQPVIIRCVRVPVRQAVNGPFSLRVVIQGGGMSFSANKFVSDLTNTVVEVPVEKYYTNEGPPDLVIEASVKVDGAAGQVFEFGGNTLGESAPGSYITNVGLANFTPAFNLGMYFTGDVRDCAVEDLAPPALTIFGDNPMNLECGDVFVDPGSSVSDDCDSALTATLEGVEQLVAPGMYDVLYTATDSKGNKTSLARQVIVQDSTDPDVALNGSATMNIECGASFTDPGATATDACEGTLAATPTGSVNPAVPAVYTLTYTATDTTGNTASLDRTVTVADTLPPVITLNGDADMVVECSSTAVWSDPGATATDACEGAKTATPVGAPDPKEPGVYNVVYTASDSGGRVGSATRKVTVSDTLKPVVTLNGAAAITLECGAAWTDPGATATDACDGTLTVTKTGDTVNNHEPGVYTLTYSAKDAGNRSKSVTRTVTVQDTTAPVMTLNGLAAMSLDCGAVWTDPGVTAADACDGSLTVTPIGTVNPAAPGAYPVIYRATDGAGHVGEVTRTVTVNDNCDIDTDVTVPNVVNMTQANASAALTAVDLVTGAISEQYHASVAVGKVISQNPAAGVEIPSGSAVALVLSLGPEPVGDVTVPNVTGITQANAEAAIVAATLTVGAVNTQHHASAPAGQVISQNPLAGAKVAPGAAVALTVSSGPAPVTVPNLVGMTQTAAGTALTAAGLAMGDVANQYHATVPVGQVISQNPAAETEVASGTEVALVVSLGPAPVGDVTVPNVTGINRAAAETAIIAATLAVGDVAEQYHATAPAGRVVSQNPLAGAKVASGTAVGLVVSLGPAPVTVPSLAGMTRAAAEAAAAAAGLAVGEVAEQYHATVDVGRVVSQNPTAGNTVAPGTAVALVVSLGPPPVGDVTVPDVVGSTQSGAAAALVAATLVAGSVTEQHHATVLAGRVISQSPAAGAKVAPGTAVTIVISLGPETIAVPTLAGMTRAAAEAALVNAGLAVGAIAEQNHATVPAGQVISQNPTAGTAVAPGATVAFVLSLGPVGGNIVVPALTGMARAAAETTLVNAELSVGAVSEQYHASVPLGQVISQNPAAGSIVAPGAAVAFVVSLGPVPVGDVTVPNVVGGAQSSAETAITAATLTVGAITEQHHATAPAGQVISQSPTAGSKVAPGTAVALVVSSGPAPATVPVLAGMTRSAAETALVNAGLTVGTVTEQYHATVPEGQVVSQSPGAGSITTPGAAVNFVLSLGPVPEEVPAPSLTGMDQEEAEQALVNAGLVVGAITEQFDATVPDGQVISQNPAPGSMLASGSVVALVISKGPAPIAVPNLVGAPQAEAQTTLQNAGLTLGAVTEAYSEEVAAGNVIAQNPAAGAEVAAGTAVSLTVSLGPEDTGCGCGCKKGAFTIDGMKRNLGDLFLMGLGLLALMAFRGRFSR